jgi:hypothetical protein
LSSRSKLAKVERAPTKVYCTMQWVHVGVTRWGVARARVRGAQGRSVAGQDLPCGVFLQICPRQAPTSPWCQDTRDLIRIQARRAVGDRKQRKAARAMCVLGRASATCTHLSRNGNLQLAEAPYGPSTDQPPRPPSDALEQPPLAHIHVPTRHAFLAARKMAPHPYQVLRRWLSSPLNSVVKWYSCS